MTRAFALIVFFALTAGPANAGGVPIQVPGDRGTCSAWHCDRTASAPLAWTRPGGGDRGMNFLSTGDLCDRHAAKIPFALTFRFALVFGFLPALLGSYVVFRILYVFDRFGPGLGWFGERPGRAVLFGLPVLAHLAWLIIYAVRAW